MAGGPHKSPRSTGEYRSALQQPRHSTAQSGSRPRTDAAKHCLLPSRLGRFPYYASSDTNGEKSMSGETNKTDDGDAKIAAVRQRWNETAARYTATANKRITLQCAVEMHSRMQLDSACTVLEVAAGSGLGSLDIVQRLTRDSDVTSTGKKQLVVTDLSPAMVKMAQERLANAGSERLDVKIMEANGQDLKDIATASTDRFVSNLCLQLTPDPDAMLRETKRVLKPNGLAGFTIWGRPENSGLFTIDSAFNKEVGLSDGAVHANFELGQDLVALRKRFAAAGFSEVRIWPFLCVLELWSGNDFAQFYLDRNFVEDEATRAQHLEIAERMGDEWLANGFPIGLETYVIIAKA
ncbi:Alanine--trna ligase, partial [Globisporangium splendens]